ncbi:MAG: hypothetical protein JSU65_14040 [Candidatus Zixiibacteriota bacterium]|nr:MAG: hypothetical protein JSU65_14040 [candidate division Zixibacteria bacterium]
MKFFSELLPVVPALLVYVWFAYDYDFYQDDAYISYRYIANFLNGDGLVYNIGERIEGYTNFGWIAYLLVWAVLGFDYLIVSKITGFLMGAAAIVVAYLTARMVLGGRNRWFAVAAVCLVGCNQSLAYWSPAGLETAPFTLCVFVSLYLYLKRSRLLICTLVYAVLLRPEGALLAGLLILVEYADTRKRPDYSLVSAAAAFLLCLPFVGFKLVYYGSILPNPFYAKTSFDLSQLSNGLEYTWRFLSHYGFFGAGLILPLILWWRLTRPVKTVWIFTIAYVMYIVLVGGDVLKVHRFFLPLIGCFAILSIASLMLLIKKLQANTQRLILVVVMIPLLVATYFLPRDFVDRYNFLEIAFTKKMAFRADRLKESDDTDFSVAVSTIGIFGYRLIGHDIIDLLGLTDSTIARYSEEPIEGMQTTWKEQKHNSRYLLERGPTYIMFSTGIKPSAPAEKALNLYPQFLRSYRTIAWYFHNKEVSPRGILTSVFKKMRTIEGEIKPTYPVEYVENYKIGLDHFNGGDHRTAITYFNKAILASPKPYNPNLVFVKAYCHKMLGQSALAEGIFNQLLAQDSLMYEVHKELYMTAIMAQQPTRAQLHRRWLLDLVPWYVPRLDSIVNQALSQHRRRPG